MPTIANHHHSATGGRRWAAALLLALLILPTAAGADDMPRHKIILDTDMGTDVDDAFCLALALSCPELEIMGVTSALDSTGDRARICCKMLHIMGRDDVPVAVGPGEKAPPNQAPWAADFTGKTPVDKSAAELIVELVNAHPGEITLVPVGPVTNVAAALALDPTIAGKLKGIVTMGGSAYIGYNLEAPPVAEYNIKMDIPAAQAVYSSGVPITMCGLDCTAMLRFEAENRELLKNRGLRLTDAVWACYELWPHETPVLYDPMALCMVIDESFCRVEEKRVVVDDEGVTQIVDGEPNVRVCVDPDVERFLRFYVERVIQPE